MKTKKLIASYWKLTRSNYLSCKDFEQSDLVRSTYERETPLWWGINDIVGWIDVRVWVWRREFEIGLFLPTKRISKNLKKKLYRFDSLETIVLPEYTTNDELRTSLILCVQNIAAQKKLHKRHIDLEGWRRLVINTDLIGVIRKPSELEMESHLKEKYP